MGVTIHFDGRLRKDVETDFVINLAKQFAEDHGMKYEIFEEENKLLERFKDEEEYNYHCSTKTIQIQPGENAEPLIFEFDSDQFMQDFCKTQFADPTVHIKIIQLLKSLEPYFEDLDVFDEGEYWDTGDANILKTHINECFQFIDEIYKKNQ